MRRHGLSDLEANRRDEVSGLNGSNWGVSGGFRGVSEIIVRCGALAWIDGVVLER